MRGHLLVLLRVPARHFRVPYLFLTIEATRLDAEATGLTPLRLEPFGEWDSAEEYRGEPGEPIGASAQKIIKRGRIPQFEMVQVITAKTPKIC